MHAAELSLTKTQVGTALSAVFPPPLPCPQNRAWHPPCCRVPNLGEISEGSKSHFLRASLALQVTSRTGKKDTLSECQGLQSVLCPPGL